MRNMFSILLYPSRSHSDRFLPFALPCLHRAHTTEMPTSVCVRVGDGGKGKRKGGLIECEKRARHNSGRESEKDYQKSHSLFIHFFFPCFLTLPVPMSSARIAPVKGSKSVFSETASSLLLVLPLFPLFSLIL